MRSATAAALCVLALAGCGAGEDIRGGGNIPGGSVTVWMIVPLHGPDAPAVRDMVAGAKLALFERGGQVGDMRVAMAVADEGVAKPEAVARAAVADIQAGAVIGGMTTEAARRETPILDAAGFLQVIAGALDPTLAGDPQLHPSGRKRLFRLVPDVGSQAEAMLAAAGAARVSVERGEGRDAQTLAAALREAAGSRLDPDARTVVYAGSDPDEAAGLADALRPGERIVFGEALARAGLRDRLRGVAARRARFVAVVPQELRPDLATAFQQRFGRAGGPYAFLGYEAMRRVLDAIAAAGRRAEFRQRIVDAYARTQAEPLAPRRWAR